MKLLIAFLFLSQFSFGQMSAIYGNIVDEDGEPGVLVRIVAISSNDSTRTMVAGCESEFNGKFYTQGLVAGQYDLIFSSIEFDTLIVEGVTVGVDRITFLKDVRMNQLYIGEPDFGLPPQPLIRKFEDLFGRSKTIKSEEIIRP